jgi:hypothetical protein
MKNKYEWLNIIPENAKKVYFQAPETAKIIQFKAP